MKKVLITGISGFAGQHLTKVLLRENYQIFGTTISSQEQKAFGSEEFKLFAGNLLEKEFVERTIAATVPDVIFHLAAFTSPARSVVEPYETIVNNVGITVNILEAIKTTKTRLVLIGSSDEYGLIKESDNPITETTPLRPTNPYAISKITQDFLGQQYYLTEDLDVVVLRPGNHIGPGQRGNFVVPAFAKQIVEIEKKHQEPTIKVGNLDSARDFTDVRDIVEGYFLASLKGKSGEVYNLGSGQSVRIGDILKKLLSLSSKKIKVIEDPSIKRKIDIPKIEIDSIKFRQVTGWQPKIELETSLKDILDYWRNNV